MPAFVPRSLASVGRNWAATANGPPMNRRGRRVPAPLTSRSAEPWHRSMRIEAAGTQAPADVVKPVAPAPGAGHGPTTPSDGAGPVATGVGDGAIVGR